MNHDQPSVVASEISKDTSPTIYRIRVPSSMQQNPAVISIYTDPIMMGMTSDASL